MLFKPLIIEQIHQEVEGFTTFTFKNGHGIEYKAGQYITFVRKSGKDEIRRSYSITSAPLLNEPLTVGVKRIANGLFSRELTDHARIGDSLLTIGAGGFFTLPEDTSPVQQIFFLAAGSGITPVYSLLKTVLNFHPHVHVVLVFSNPSPPKTIFFHQLIGLSEKFTTRFQLQFLFSNTPDLSLARLNRELLSQIIRSHTVSGPGKTLFYLCGPEPYMRMCTYTLQEINIPGENIRRENFNVGEKPLSRARPPDLDPHLVTIQYGDEKYQFTAQYPDSILRSAKKAGITLPYSCETGRCGSCAATCISGKVWLSYNEVLTDKDLQSGLTLTCVGHPVDGDVILKIGT